MIVTRLGVSSWPLICIIGCLALASGPVFGYIISGVLQLESESQELFEVDHASSSYKRTAAPDEADLKDSIDKMGFYKGQQTSFKRSWPIPQLQCKAGCDNYEPGTLTMQLAALAMVECTSVESPDQESKWRCETDLPRHLKFRKTTINCEGSESAEDDKVLRGSCGLEYSLANNGLSPIPGRVHRHYYTVGPRPSEEEGMKGWTASWLLVTGVIIYVINHNWKSFKTPGFDSTSIYDLESMRIIDSRWLTKMKDFMLKSSELIGHGKEEQKHARVEEEGRHLG